MRAKKKIKSLLFLLIISVWLSGTSWAVANILNVQGQVSPPPPITPGSGGIYVHIFSSEACDPADDVGGYRTDYLPLNSYLTNDGRFNVNIELSDQNFLSDDYWLQVTINNGTPYTFSPQRLSASPFAITARNVISDATHNGIVSAVSPTFAVYGTTTGSFDVAGVGGSSETYAGKGIWGNAPAGTGVTGTGWLGVVGRADNGSGVTGQTSSGLASGVLGISGVAGQSASDWSTFGAAVTGVSRDENGGPGVKGASRSTIAPGVYGYSNHNYGILGKSNNANFAGIAGTGSEVYGGTIAGVMGRARERNSGPAIVGISESNNSPGIIGIGTRYTGVVGQTMADGFAGVYGATQVEHGIGVLGESLGPGHGPAIRGEANRGEVGVLGDSINNHGVLGRSEVGQIESGTYAGVYGYNFSQPNGIGVKGIASAARGGGIGVKGINESNRGIGVYGSNLAAGDIKSPFMVKTFKIPEFRRDQTRWLPLPGARHVYGIVLSAYSTGDAPADILPNLFTLDEYESAAVSNWVQVLFFYNAADAGASYLEIRNKTRKNVNVRGMVFYGDKPNNSN